jgi:flagellar hook-basal body complex protein FliE
MATPVDHDIDPASVRLVRSRGGACIGWAAAIWLNRRGSATPEGRTQEAFVIPPVAPLPGTSSLPVSSASSSSSGSADQFTGMLQNALSAVSQSQEGAAAAENAVATGAPGASTSTALVLSDKAELNWTALVAVRNEVVSAYQTIMNMQI